MGSAATAAAAQEPTKRARPQEHIPVKKEEALPPVTKVVEVKGTNTEVVPPPVVTNIVTEAPGANTMISAAAPGIGAAPVPWLPLLGLLGGAAVLATRHHGTEEVVQTTTTPPVVTPPPVVPPVPPEVPPVTAVPEPATLALFATGLLGLAVTTRRKRAVA